MLNDPNFWLGLYIGSVVGVVATLAVIFTIVVRHLLGGSRS